MLSIVVTKLPVMLVHFIMVRDCCTPILGVKSDHEKRFQQLGVLTETAIALQKSPFPFLPCRRSPVNLHSYMTATYPDGTLFGRSHIHHSVGYIYVHHDGWLVIPFLLRTRESHYEHHGIGRHDEVQRFDTDNTLIIREALVPVFELHNVPAEG
jgi:hypothetical protein